MAVRSGRCRLHGAGRGPGGCERLLSALTFALKIFLSAAGNLHMIPGVPLGAADGGAGAVLPPSFLGSSEGWHQGAIYAVAFGADGGLLATGARDRLVAVWNLTKGLFKKKPLRLEGHTGGVTALTFGRVDTSGEEFLVSGGADNTSRVWDARTGELQRSLEHPKTVFGVAARSSGAAARRASAAAVAEEEALAEGSTEFATACWDGVVRLFSWPPSSGAGHLGTELRGHSGGLYSVAYSPLDGSLLATASADRTVRVWDLRRQEVLWVLRSHRDHVTTVDWSPRDRFVLASGAWDRRFRLWELGDSEVESCRTSGVCSTSVAPRATKQHPQLVWRVAFSTDGELVAACHGAVGQSPTVVVYSVATARVVRRLGRHKDTPLVISWSPDGSMLASAGMDRKVLVYEAQSELDDVPQGDADDAEERSLWRKDLADLSGNWSAASTTNTSQNATAALSDDPAAAAAAAAPHPLVGRRAFM